MSAEASEAAKNGTAKNGAPRSGAAELKELRKRLAEECAAKVNALLEEHECALVGVPSFSPEPAGGWKIVVRVEVVPKG